MGDKPFVVSARHASDKSHAERMYSPGAASTSSTIEETAENLLKAADLSPNLSALNDAANSRRKRLEEEFVSNKKARVDNTKPPIEHLEQLEVSFAVNQDRTLKIISGMTDDLLISLLAAPRKSTGISAFLKLALQIRLENNKVKLKDVLEQFHFQANDKEPLKHPWVDYLIFNAAQLKKDPYDVLLEKFASVYQPYDPKISDILAQAKNDPTTESVAENLQFRLLEHTRKGIRSVFKNLHLHKQDIEDVLNDPRLRTWFAYVQLRRKDPFEMMNLAMKKKT
ncbi:hypothetical protein PsorP6_016136 [Peronosclerospora sorghi]|uniref:Uncharacterized protein n=1 Tax=Peronosclerospora sorghi TaxID=230839 RepID=A0ACC0VMD5_9STRA|nr:hypothetical protein PsorP6_016136 [Peronosclerospora sorghi]